MPPRFLHRFYRHSPLPDLLRSLPRAWCESFRSFRFFQVFSGCYVTCGLRISRVLLGFVIGFQVSDEKFFGSLGEKPASHRSLAPVFRVDCRGWARRRGGRGSQSRTRSGTRSRPQFPFHSRTRSAPQSCTSPNPPIPILPATIRTLVHPKETNPRPPTPPHTAIHDRTQPSLPAQTPSKIEHSRTQSNTVEQGRTTSARRQPQDRANTCQHLTQPVHPKRTISRNTLDIARSPPSGEQFGSHRNIRYRAGRPLSSRLERGGGDGWL